MMAKPRYLTTRPGKNGELRYFWQPPAALKKHGFKTQRLSAIDPAAAAERLNEGLDAWRTTGQKPAVHKGTINAVIADYKASFRFREKSAMTRKTYSYALRVISAELGDRQARLVTTAQCQDVYRQLRRQPAKAMLVASVMNVLFEHARRTDIVTINPASKPDISYKASKGALWPREAITAFVEAADALNIFDMGTAVCLNEWIGQRPSDILSMRIGAYRNGHLFKKQKKTGGEVTLPVDMVPHLKARLAEQLARNHAKNPASLYMFPGVHGAGMSEAVFNATFNLVRNAAGLPKKLTFRTLRHTAITRLGEAGVPLQLIAAVSGHSFKTCEQILDRYNIRTAMMAQEAFRLRLEAEARAA